MGPAALSRLLQWTARVAGTLLLLFLLYMLVGHLTGDANGPTGMVFRSGRERLAFFFFPVCTIVGLVLAYRWELAGGGVVLGSLIALCAVRPDLVRPAFLALSVPGLLYLLHWAVERWGRRG